MQYWNCCKTIKNYSGTAILISDKFGGKKPSKVTYDMGIDLHALEGRLITAWFE